MKHYNTLLTLLLVIVWRVDTHFIHYMSQVEWCAAFAAVCALLLSEPKQTKPENLFFLKNKFTRNNKHLDKGG